MATSTLAQRYRVNGVVNTDNPVMDNLEQLARSSGCFITYDGLQGKWGVIINTVSSSVKSFDNSNIVGPINLTTTSLLDLYNGIEVEFPLLDTADKTDYVRIKTPSGDRSLYEPDNIMKMTLNFCTEPVQAHLLGKIELLQSRLDKVITFKTDYSALQLNAGDVIDVTHDLYQFNQKLFRIITIKETDGDNGDLACDITALEYDAAIYSTANLPRSCRTDLTGIQTIGAITAPSVSFNKDESAARPFIEVISTVPSGVIEGVECWLSSDDVTYELRQTIKQDESTLTAGSSVTFQFDDQPAGTVYAKTRGTNYSVSGPFSAVASTSYNPVQITDGIDENTDVFDGGLPLSLLLALPDLLGALDGFLNGNDDMSEVFDETLANASGLGGTLFAYQKIITGGNIDTSGNMANLTTSSTMAFTVTKSGNYVYALDANFGKDVNVLDDRVIEAQIWTGNSYGSGTYVAKTEIDTSDAGTDVYNDLDCSGIVTLTPGDYHSRIRYSTDEAGYIRFNVTLDGPITYSGIEGDLN
jgi:hypothetical protein